MIALYGIAAYLAFLSTVALMAGFLLGFGPLQIDVGAATVHPAVALLIDLGLVALFGLQHSSMARARFKEWFTSWVPARAERSTYVLVASLLLCALALAWQPLPQPIWSLHLARLIVTGVAVAGWIILIGSTFAIDHFAQFGLRPTLLPPRDSDDFVVPLAYRFVRHPQYFGFLIVFWATPDMTAGRLLFAAGMTAYIFVGIFFEERDLLARFGDRYAEYKRRVRMLLPLP